MRKSLLTFLVSLLALVAGVLALAWINTRRRPAAPGRSTSRQPSSPRSPRPRTHRRTRRSEPSATVAPREESPSAGPTQTDPKQDSTPTGQSRPERCTALTGSGRRCSRPAQEGSPFCWQHQD